MTHVASRLLALAMAILGITLLASGAASAQDDGVTLSVTPGGRVAISVAPNVLDFGMISPGESGPAGPVIVTNDGTVKVQLAVQYVDNQADCDPDGAVDWSAVNGEPRADQFRLSARLGGDARRNLSAQGHATRLSPSSHLDIGASQPLTWELAAPPLPYGGADPTVCRIRTVVIAFAATNNDD
jgi:hypothetical protein